MSQRLSAAALPAELKARPWKGLEQLMETLQFSYDKVSSLKEPFPQLGCHLRHGEKIIDLHLSVFMVVTCVYRQCQLA